MQWAMYSAALDDRAPRELAAEWERHCREVAAISVTSASARWEFHQHTDRIEAIMQALLTRLRYLPGPDDHIT